MRQYTPGAEYDEKELKDLRAEPWMLELLELNPSYVSWGVHEDYMCKQGDDEPWHEERHKLGMPERKHGWEARILLKNWAEHTIEPNDLNEVVNFHFSIERDAKDCDTCQATGYHPDAMWISETFYAHMAEKLTDRLDELSEMEKKYPGFVEHMRSCAASPGGWHTCATQDEVDALAVERRLMDFTHTFVPEQGWKPKDPPYKPVAKEVNEWAAAPRSMGHDAINRMIMIEARLKRLGIPKNCPQCAGDGSIYTAEHPRVVLTYWLLHPRKGASRGVEVADIQQQDLPQVFMFLKHAAERNTARFAKVVEEARRRV